VWSLFDSHSGAGDDRTFHFDATDSEHSRPEWVCWIREHMEHAQKTSSPFSGGFAMPERSAYVSSDEEDDGLGSKSFSLAQPPGKFNSASQPQVLSSANTSAPSRKSTGSTDRKCTRFSHNSSEESHVSNRTVRFSPAPSETIDFIPDESRGQTSPSGFAPRARATFDEAPSDDTDEIPGLNPRSRRGTCLNIAGAKYDEMSDGEEDSDGDWLG
jgi:hypothetical protein